MIITKVKNKKYIMIVDKIFIRIIDLKKQILFIMNI